MDVGGGIYRLHRGIGRLAIKLRVEPSSRERLFRGQYAQRRRTYTAKRHAREVDASISAATEQHGDRDNGEIAMPARDLGATPTGGRRWNAKIDLNQEFVRANIGQEVALKKIPRRNRSARPRARSSCSGSTSPRARPSLRSAT